MAKILTDKELGEIVWKATHDEGVIDCADTYTHFLEDLVNLVCDHFGGIRGNIISLNGWLPWAVRIYIDECVPPDGGVFKDYDTGVRWQDGEEQD